MAKRLSTDEKINLALIDLGEKIREVADNTGQGDSIKLVDVDYIIQISLK